LRINALGALNINIIFRPQALGLRTASMQIIIPNDTVYVELVGISTSIGLLSLHNFIDFENVFIDDYIDKMIPLAVNISDNEIELFDLTITGPHNNNYKLLGEPLRRHLKPNDTLYANIRFFPLTIGRKYSVLNLTNSFHSFPMK
jgi:hypothetical protein